MKVVRREITAGGYTVSLFLPLARRRFKTWRPDLVAILTRKPCVLFRFVLLFTVRFNFILMPHQIIEPLF